MNINNKLRYFKSAVAFFFLFFLHGTSIGTRQQGISYNDIFISIDPTESDAYYGGFLTLQQWELKELIEHLNTLLDE
ncbi:hypothetical protein UFOVP1483_9 [uncultured Caudovirales phage]|uniref:Uncharacterized protein n=1 Tax=uncultured Caudovirales phage TaxID=2100421 RepID=A0A6J5SN50_9CAUD|nr:hypothetical protein UFOVP1483_9 [uncultured Caudovirales phage]